MVKQEVKDVTDLAVVEKDQANGNWTVRYTWKGTGPEWLVGRKTEVDPESGDETAVLDWISTNTQSSNAPKHRAFTAQRHHASAQWLVKTPVGYHVVATPEEALDVINADYESSPKGRTVNVTIANVKIDHGVKDADFARRVAEYFGNNHQTLNGPTFGAKNVTITEAPAKGARK
jgi:hypothetical protein